MSFSASNAIRTDVLWNPLSIRTTNEGRIELVLKRVGKEKLVDSQSSDYGIKLQLSTDNLELVGNWSMFIAVLLYNTIYYII